MGDEFSHPSSNTAVSTNSSSNNTKWQLSPGPYSDRGEKHTKRDARALTASNNSHRLLHYRESAQNTPPAAPALRFQSTISATSSLRIVPTVVQCQSLRTRQIVYDGRSSDYFATISILRVYQILARRKAPCTKVTQQIHPGLTPQPGTRQSHK